MFTYRLKQRGISLIELMIAMTLALLLTLVITIVYLGSVQTSRNQDDNAQLQEMGRFGLEVLRRHLLPMGYVDNSPTNRNYRFSDIAAVPAVMGCESSDFTASFSSFACGTANTSDSFTLSYQAQPVSGDNGASLSAFSATSGVGTDCLGQDGGMVAISRFFVGADGLQCEGNGNIGAPITLLPGVEDMEITYGYDSDGNEAVDRYYTASEIGTATTEWEKVRYVKVCLLIASQNNNVAASTQTYYDCGGTSQTATDRKIRRTFTAVYNLRMRISGTPDNA